MNALHLEPAKLKLLSAGSIPGGIQNQSLHCEDPILSLLDNLERLLATDSSVSSSQRWQDVATSFQQVRRLLREQSLEVEEAAGHPVRGCLREIAPSLLHSSELDQSVIGTLHYSHSYGDNKLKVTEGLWDCPLNDY